MDVKFRKMTEEEFFKQREEVLTGWPTGKDVDLDEAVEFLKKVPDEKNFAKKMAWADEQGITTAQPRAGVALINEHIELLQHLQNEGGADFLPSTIDAYTRQNRYEEGERGIIESEAAGRSLLNGFPAVNHGVKGCRQVFEAVDLPLQLRHGTPDSRLLAEVGHAGGFTSNEGGAISYNIPYSKKVSVEKTVRDWQYCDRLVGYYEDNGVTINREPFGPLTGTLVPPSTSNAVGILEALLAAEQGVKNITVGYGQCGNLLQDVAAVNALREQTKEYLKAYGYDDVILTTVFHQWMGGFPEDESRAFGLISLGAAAAALSGATKVIVKTPHEAIGIPTKEANAAGIKATKMVLNLLEGQRYADSQALRDEINIIKAEVKCMLDETLRLGNGDWAVGTVKAFETGVIDIPFGPSDYNAGKMLPARDNEGFIRYLEVGNIPLSKELLDFNKGKFQERAKFEDRDVSFQMVVDDIFAVSRGKLVGRPGDDVK
ncbi:MAG: methylaspartate mutase subunit E [Tissierellia bacterium]|nr:methylaspartate mutase subunit E [Tissierellia bacterium]